MLVSLNSVIVVVVMFMSNLVITVNTTLFYYAYGPSDPKVYITCSPKNSFKYLILRKSILCSLRLHWKDDIVAKRIRNIYHYQYIRCSGSIYYARRYCTDNDIYSMHLQMFLCNIILTQLYFKHCYYSLTFIDNVNCSCNISSKTAKSYEYLNRYCGLYLCNLVTILLNHYFCFYISIVGFKVITQLNYFYSLFNILHLHFIILGYISLLVNSLLAFIMSRYCIRLGIISQITKENPWHYILSKCQGTAYKNQ